MIRSTLKYTLKTFLVVGICLVGYGLVALLLSTLTHSKESENQKDIAIYILTNGVHTDIVVPKTSTYFDWQGLFPLDNVAVRDSSFRYLSLGWGDKGFYLETPTWSDLKVSTAFKAAFGLSNSAIHATYYKTMQEGGNCVKIELSDKQYLRLIRFVKNSLILSENGKSSHIQTDANYGKSDAFYDAKGRYSMFYTCNTWANEALKAAGQKCCVWTPIDKSIFAKYK